MVVGEKRKVVCFALDKERDLYELASTINFSAFVKRHLIAEIRRRHELQQRGEITVHIGEEETV